MSHNKQVTANIKQIKADVEAATTQDQLIQVITSVKNHPGPLNYDDRLPSGMMWALTALSVYGMLLNYIYGGSHSSLARIMFAVVDNSAYWVPALVAFAVARRLENKGQHLPLPQFLARPFLRIGLITGVVTLVAAYLPPWHQAYWFVFAKLMQLLSLNGQVYVPFNLAAGAGVVALILWFWLRKRKYWRNPVSDRIHLLDILFNNNLKPVKVDPEGKAKELKARFREFDRGNHRRTIDAFYEGEYQGEVHTFRFQLYHFHYVNRRQETYTDSNGKTRTRTTYDHYHRHGLLFDFPFAKSVVLDGDRDVSYRGEKYTTASNAFNRLFRVRTRDQMQAARLLTPATVEMLTQFAESFRSPVVEIDAKGQTCLAINDQDLLKLKRRSGLDTPDAFIKEISGHAKLDKLDALLNTVHHLMRLSDNNFK
ncbi:DUF3137 domain-containing protein [Ferrimonas sp. YFM]|uniref:DUF3137 domain-containing protein n=1 Tax=Ferrimonas sp. YFM TaxID=3028878 RepID=UPI0025743358|nr:DUF3137 domain-containing protein [Ferrimonas sp. YFM]BDY05187.1 hypothetical protein F0521_22280 [Ferrimonas sp. YFM]